MRHHDRPAKRLAVYLAALAGFVDAIGFLKLGGLFVSFMSGNSTRLAVGIVEGSGMALRASLLIAAFVSGVMAGSILSAKIKERRQSAILGLVSALLLCAALLDCWDSDRLAVGLMAVAMGCANTVFQRDGEVSIGVTYMTGTLVKLGQRLADVVLGGDRMAWLPYLTLWLGLIAGAVAGAWGFGQIGLKCLWIAAAASGLLAIAARNRDACAI